MRKENIIEFMSFACALDKHEADHWLRKCLSMLLVNTNSIIATQRDLGLRCWSTIISYATGLSNVSTVSLMINRHLYWIMLEVKIPASNFDTVYTSCISIPKYAVIKEVFGFTFHDCLVYIATVDKLWGTASVQSLIKICCGWLMSWI